MIHNNFVYLGHCPTRVRRHFRFEAKWSETEAKFFSLRCKKSAFFACFASMRNVEIWSEMKMERSQNKMKKKRKTAISFAPKWNEAKRKWKTAILFASKRNEAKRKRKTAIIFALKQNGSEIFFASMRKNEMKRKQNKKEATTSKRKRIKWNSGTISKESKKNIKAGLLLFHVYT